MEDGKTNIYFVTDGTSVKIGRSLSIKDRISSLSTGNPNELTLLYSISDVDISFERHLHEICQKYSIKGEWFEMGAIDLLMKHQWYKENMLKPRTPSRNPC